MIQMVMRLAPFVPSRPEVITRMLKISNTCLDDVVFDLGCGDGRILMSAVKDFGARRAVGYEMKTELYRQVLDEIANQNLTEQIFLFNDDLMNADLSEASVIALYLTTSGNEHLKPKIANEAVRGTRIVSHDFEFRGWHPSVKEDFRGHTLFLYIVPEAFHHL